MGDFKIIFYLYNGCMLMLLNMGDKIYKIIMHFKEELKYYKNKAKDGIKLICIYYLIRYTNIMKINNIKHKHNNNIITIKGIVTIIFVIEIFIKDKMNMKIKIILTIIITIILIININNNKIEKQNRKQNRQEIMLHHYNQI